MEFHLDYIKNTFSFRKKYMYPNEILPAILKNYNRTEIFRNTEKNNIRAKLNFYKKPIVVFGHC